MAGCSDVAAGMSAIKRAFSWKRGPAISHRCGVVTVDVAGVSVQSQRNESVTGHGRTSNGRTFDTAEAFLVESKV